MPLTGGKKKMIENKESMQVKSKSITFGDMAESLHRLRNKYGLYYNHSEQEIFEEAKKNKKNIGVCMGGKHKL